MANHKLTKSQLDEPAGGLWWTWAAGLEEALAP